MASNSSPPRTTNDTSQGGLIDIDQDAGHQQHPEALGASDPDSKDSGRSTSKASNILNDASLITNRRICSNQMIRRGIELMAEDKLSKYRLEEVHTSLPSSIKTTFIMTFSPDGQRVASTHGDHLIYICDLLTGKLLDTLEGHLKTPWCLAWHPNAKDVLASGCLAGEVRVWDLKSKACESWNNQRRNIINSIDFHPFERILVIATSNDIHFWDWSEPEPFATTTAVFIREKIKYVRFDPTGRRLITGINNVPRYQAGSNTEILADRSDLGSYEQPEQEAAEQILPSQLNHTGDSSHRIFVSNPPSIHLQTPSDSANRIRGHSQDTTPRVQPTLEVVIPDRSLSYRAASIMSQMAHAYQQLEILEDAVRHILPTLDNQLTQERGESSQRSNHELISTPSGNNPYRLTHDHRDAAAPVPESSSVPNRASLDSSDFESNRNQSLERDVISFDELIERIQLLPTTIDEQVMTLNSIRQQSIARPSQCHYIIQLESMHQVSQTYIRISRLMSSVRRYRRIVQQISSGPFEPLSPNQTLNVQSSPVAYRPAAMVHEYLRFPLEEPFEMNPYPSPDVLQGAQYRDTARIVPLTKMCKIDLLIGRSLCILKCQSWFEEFLSNLRDYTQGETEVRRETMSSRGREQEQIDSRLFTDVFDSILPLSNHLSQLHRSLLSMNPGPLTTSNVFAIVPSMRSALRMIFHRLVGMYSSSEEFSRLENLIYHIARNLTGRDWSQPMGASMLDVRLDVVNVLCVVDLTLHLVRQFQLLLMQRLSAFTRLEESRRQIPRATHSTQASSSVQSSSNQIPSTSCPDPSLPSTSRCEFRTSEASSSKRKDTTSPSDDEAKRRRVETPGTTSDERNSPASEPQLDNMRRDILRLDAQTFSRARLIGATARLTPLQPATQEDLGRNLRRLLVAAAALGGRDLDMVMRVYERVFHNVDHAWRHSNEAESEQPNSSHESRRRALSQDDATSNGSEQASQPPSYDQLARHIQGAVPEAAQAEANNAFNDLIWRRQPFIQLYQTRGAGIWINQVTVPLSGSWTNYRIQCWNFDRELVPGIRDPLTNLVTGRCRIFNDSSIDISSDGNLIACLVPQEDSRRTCAPKIDLMIFSIKAGDFGVCYHQLPHGPNAVSISLSPSSGYVVVGLTALHQSNSDDRFTLAHVFKLEADGKHRRIRSITVKKSESFFNLNAIRWMPRGIVYNVGPQQYPRYGNPRMHRYF